MNTDNEHQYLRFNDKVWDFLAEYPLIELLVDMDLREKPEAGLLFQTVRTLGLRRELLDILERKLVEFATQAPAKLNQRRFEAPTYVRLFCQRDAIDDSASAQSSEQHKSGRTLKSTQIIDHSKPEIYGGWGYFLVERGVSSKIGVSPAPINWIDLYLYKEGE